MRKESFRKILVVTSEAFPYGMAGTARIISLSKGFISNGIETQVLSMFKYGEDDDPVQNPVNGKHEGISFYNVFPTTRKENNIIKRLHDEYSKFILIFFESFKRVDKVTIIYYYSSEFLPAISLKIVSWLKHTVLIKEETEHPTIRVLGKNIFYRYMFLNFHYKIFDALFVITQSLADCIKNERGFKKPVYIFPMIVDVDRFNKGVHSRKHEIVFSGVLDDQKEGVDLIIRAFSYVVAKYPIYTLNLYGKANSDIQTKRYQDLITELNLHGKVILHGYKIHEEIINILNEAEILVFARPISLQANYGFSTKLGEYLATGNPVVATNTGETGKFLDDRINIFFCEPNVTSIKEKIFEIINDYDYAISVGRRGKLCVLENFNNKVESSKAIDFMNRIKLNSK